MIAHDQMVKGRKDLLIGILKDRISVNKLPAALRVYIRNFISDIIGKKYEICNAIICKK